VLLEPLYGLRRRANMRTWFHGLAWSAARSAAKDGDCEIRANIDY
jgi:hypothetical protein